MDTGTSKARPIFAKKTIFFIIFSKLINKNRKKNNKKKSKSARCYYCKMENIKDKKKHRKTCEIFLKKEKKSVRAAKQTYFGKKKATPKKKKATPKKKKKTQKKKSKKKKHLRS